MALHIHDQGTTVDREPWLLHLADYVAAAMLLDRASALDVMALVFRSGGCFASPFPVDSRAPLDEAGALCEALAAADRARELVS